jgi:hypothetical protein
MVMLSNKHGKGFTLVEGNEFAKKPEHPNVVWNGTSVAAACAVLKGLSERQITWVEFPDIGSTFPSREMVERTVAEFKRFGICVDVRYAVKTLDYSCR